MTAAAVDIPRIDLARGRDASQRVALANELVEVCHAVGFFCIVNHGVEPAFLRRTFEYAQRLFALPAAHKQLIDKRASRHFRGWEDVGSEYTNGRPDLREQVDLWTEHPALAADASPAYLRLYGPNQWLPESLLPGFRAHMDTWFEVMAALGDELLALLAVGLSLPADTFARRFGAQRMSLTKLIRYPATPPGAFGVNAHHDTGFVTILDPGGVPGLQIETADGSWTGVPPVDGALVVNLGEMLQAMTGNYLVATPHRVVAGRERVSVGYFHGPSLDAELAPLPLDARFADAVRASPRHAGAGFMAPAQELGKGVGDMRSGYRPSTYGEQLWNYFERSYPEHVRRHYGAA